ncbi:MAG: DUF3871 family protein [Sphingobacteriaceae bacterium]|nr:DUF3871 family protein [Sphingobacteriaceae bacterium]
MDSPGTQLIDVNETGLSTDKPFIISNTVQCPISEMRDSHIIPVFVKDNEPAINHTDFIEVVQEVAKTFYRGETILQPNIRVSHPIKGRIPEARLKQAKDLEESEKTIYYERMAFIMEIPSVVDTVSGNQLTLTIGGVKAYNLDNLYNRKGVDEHFKVFIGFQNKVCTNLCISSDGYVKDLKVKSIDQLMDGILSMVQRYDPVLHLKQMKRMDQSALSEQQFAMLIGRCRMYPYVPKDLKKEIQPLEFVDTQLGSVVRDYYTDESFCREIDGSINLWKVYNLFTGANKSSYIDTFLERADNAYHFTGSLASAIEQKHHNWFLN